MCVSKLWLVIDEERYHWDVCRCADVQVADEAKSDADVDMTCGSMNNPSAASDDDVRQMSIDAMALLRHDENKLYQHAKYLAKKNVPLACAIFTTIIDGWTPIHACAQKGSKKLVKVMLNSGIDVNFAMGQPEGLPGRCTLMHVAANAGHVKIMDHLIGRGSDINAKDSYGRTPLFYANRSSKREAIKTLLDNNAMILYPGTGGPSFDCPATPQPKLTNFCLFLFKS